MRAANRPPTVRAPAAPRSRLAALAVSGSDSPRAATDWHLRHSEGTDEGASLSYASCLAGESSFGSSSCATPAGLLAGGSAGGSHAFSPPTSQQEPEQHQRQPSSSNVQQQQPS